MGTKTPGEVVAMLQQRTRGLAPVHANKERRKSQKRSANGDEDHDDDPDESHGVDGDVVLVDRASSVAPRKKAKTTRPADSNRDRKPLHTHSFVTIGVGKQQCSDKACGFTMEFESF